LEKSNIFDQRMDKAGIIDKNFETEFDYLRKHTGLPVPVQLTDFNYTSQTEQFL
jgi:hypothetical protein